MGVSELYDPVISVIRLVRNQRLCLHLWQKRVSAMPIMHVPSPKRRFPLTFGDGGEWFFQSPNRSGKSRQGTLVRYR